MMGNMHALIPNSETLLSAGTPSAFGDVGVGSHCPRFWVTNGMADSCLRSAKSCLTACGPVSDAKFAYVRNKSSIPLWSDFGNRRGDAKISATYQRLMAETEGFEPSIPVVGMVP